VSARFALLPAEGLLHISGTDTIKFLHSQASADLRRVAEGQAAHGTFCTPQGRVICDFLAVQIAADHVALRMRNSIIDHAISALSRFAVFSKVSLHRQMEGWQVLGCWGDDAREAMAGLFDTLPDTTLGCARGENAVLVQTDATGHQFEYLVKEPQPAEQLNALLTAAPASAWEAEQVRCGLARIEAVTIGEFLPEQLNYDLTGHINFRKGCYPGQEVIARMHYKGKAKRRMILARLPEGEIPAAGSPLYNQDREQPVGNIVNAGFTVDGATLALVPCTRKALAQGLRLAPDAATVLQQRELPYPVELN
jgi:folate-binding protein YgfZ